MSRIPPSAHIAQAISDFFANGISENNDVKTTLFRLGAQRLIQELLEQEVTDFLGREDYQRRNEENENNGFRSGYKERSIKTAEGKIPVYRPQVRDSDKPFVSRLWQFLKGNSDVLQYLVMEMYAEKSALKLAFATLWRTSQRWRKVRFTEIEQKLIAELRKKLGLITENAEEESQNKEKDDSAA